MGLCRWEFSAPVQRVSLLTSLQKSSCSIPMGIFLHIRPDIQHSGTGTLNCSTETGEQKGRIGESCSPFIAINRFFQY